ncbi:MAG TPA: hypothetical protein VMV53_09145 [Acidimicrobiales bacterium]|nr:hypothetical protein [Acidimicrobiales bacterium]
MTPLARRWPVALAAAWALLWLGVAFTYHINEPSGVQSITMNGRTYVGSPPALSLFERDNFSVLLAMVLVTVAILVAFLDVTSRRRRADRRPGPATVVAGSLLVAFSLFGLLWGILSIGVVGLLLILASRPPRPAVAA